VHNFTCYYEDGKIPLYAVIELFSFGMLSKFYSNMQNADKKAIAKIDFNVGYAYLESWLESISFVRNICAHYGRLYNVNLVKRPMLYDQYKTISNYRIFSVILCFKHLIDDKGLWLTFKTELEALVDKYKNSINLECVGFPEAWLNLL
jgi:abortive infection bacteriophage resistance protein